MGKGPKHGLNQVRHNPIFKVAGTALKDKKGKPKEVTSKLKSVFNKGKNKADSAKKITDLDSQLSQLQKDSVERGKNMAGSAAMETPIAPLPVKPPRVEEADMVDLSQLLKANS